MRWGVSRRHFLAVAGGATAGSLLAGCGSDRDKHVKAASLVSVQIGERLVRLPHPALRVLGVVLIASGTLAVTYLSLTDGTEQNESVRLTQDEAQRLDVKRRVAFVREDGKVEERAIDEVKSGPP